MRSEAKQVSGWIGRSAAEVYDYVSDPTNIPSWARGLGDSVENVDGRWFVETPSGRVGVAFAEPNSFGVLDHEVTLPSGEVIYVPMRVLADGDGCEVVFTVRRLPHMSDEDFARDAGLVQADLTRLKQVLERPGQGRPSRKESMRFHTTLLQSDKTATGIEVPPEVVEALAAGKRPPVRVTINGFTYRSTIAVMGGRYMVGVSADNRAGAGVKGGDEIDVDIELDNAPREVVVPAELAAALDADPAARRTFDALSYSNQSWHVLQVTGARTDETRDRRIAKSIAALREGRPR